MLVSLSQDPQVKLMVWLLQDHQLLSLLHQKQVPISCVYLDCLGDWGGLAGEHWAKPAVSWNSYEKPVVRPSL